ncbi:MAG: hypothetical protein BMS9Abin37_3088 [Acidobacteriota bacterium]|nr:MAG: hypothetical protein BMS9Abin37_3088 [Acidobacteriota bacterium]
MRCCTHTTDCMHSGEMLLALLLSVTSPVNPCQNGFITSFDGTFRFQAREVNPSSKQTLVGLRVDGLTGVFPFDIKSVR